MRINGPAPPASFLQHLKRLGEGAPNREVIQGILEELINVVGAERGFLFRVRNDGGFRVLLARNRDCEAIARPGERISLHAVRRALESKAPYFVQDARRDRRYRTEESVRTRRAPISILTLPLRSRGEIDGGVYLDNRFQVLTISSTILTLVEHWRALLEIGLQARERERLLSRARQHGRTRARQPTPRVPAPVPQIPPVVVEFHDMVGASPDMLDLFDAAVSLGPSDLPVVLSGETGTGKELLARAIHNCSRRAVGPFQAVSCGGIPDSLLESELFGHVRGAFTGAEMDRTGLLIQADGGTVFLDEVGDMSPQMQQKLLHVLEDGRVRPLGRKNAVHIDVRILSSTHDQLERLVEAGRFRKDLYYRLRGTVLFLPPLRERKEEILILAERFLEKYGRSENQEPPQLKDKARRRLLRYPWPGNVRELENEMRRLVGLGESSLEERHLSRFILDSRELDGPAARDSTVLNISEVVSEAEQSAIRKALERSGGNKSQAAKLLGITRKALYRRMTRYGVT